MSESEEDGHHIIKETSAAQCSKLSYCWASIPAQSLWAAGFLICPVSRSYGRHEGSPTLRWTLFGPFSREAMSGVSCIGQFF
jgi:hypothetical protein